MNKIIIITILFLCIGCSDNKASIISYGIVNSTIVETEKAPDSATGTINSIDSWNLIKTTTEVPSELGADFGIKYVVPVPFNKESITVEELIIFPDEGITNPDTGKTHKVDSEFIDILPNEERYFTYKLESPWEIKHGSWVLQVKKDGIIILQKTFHIK